jgi:hypothetical protein
VPGHVGTAADVGVSAPGRGGAVFLDSEASSARQVREVVPGRQVRDPGRIVDFETIGLASGGSSRLVIPKEWCGDVNGENSTRGWLRGQAARPMCDYRCEEHRDCSRQSDDATKHGPTVGTGGIGRERSLVTPR